MLTAKQIEEARTELRAYVRGAGAVPPNRDDQTAFKLIDALCAQAHLTAEVLAEGDFAGHAAAGDNGMKHSPFDIRAADKLAYEVSRLVRRGVIDARSEAADRLLDYASGRFGDSNPIGDLERIFEPTGAKGGDCTDTEPV